MSLCFLKTARSVEYSSGMTLIFFVTLIFTFLQGCKNENITTKVLVLPRSYMNCYFCYTGDINGLGYEKLGLNTCGDFGPDDRSHLKMCSPGQTCKQCLTMLDDIAQYLRKVPSSQGDRERA